MSNLPTDRSAVHEEWHDVYRQLSIRPSTALRRRLLALSAKALVHEHWLGRSTGAWAALQGARHGRAA
ncbi:hypothetical protein GTW40_27560 [Streptomyces sp. SID4985]|uniref:hypothetical protein n=1 Tax=Streptomyces sp. SID4985 TaxID=2690292 RepID=UPI00136AC885|nr:hypothetical protein [Streptomyces sp. SID4985]MYQ48746.1 hypothetical protein [Streptomyces sp. SID4985]